MLGLGLWLGLGLGLGLWIWLEIGLPRGYAIGTSLDLYKQSLYTTDLCFL